MKKDNVLKYKNPTENTVTDVLTEFLRDSAQQMLKVAIDEEVNSFIEMHKSKHLTNGRQQVVRNGYLPKRPYVNEHAILALWFFFSKIKWHLGEKFRGYYHLKVSSHKLGLRY